MGLYHHLVRALFVAAAAAQQGVLSNGNSVLPECGRACAKLVQGAQACSGTDVATQSTWICFCQSAYLTTLRSSAAGVCDDTCTDPNDVQQLSTWYSTNCGSDNGASEHADDGTATAATTAAAANGGTTAVTTNSGSGSSGSTGSTGGNTLGGVRVGVDEPETWWENHYKWIIMLIVFIIAFPLLAWAAVWWKRRHDRKQDQITDGFNAGITTRAPPMSDNNANRSNVSVLPAGAGSSGSGRNSPQRTPDAFMPYGYGYARSESRNGSQRGMHPLARGATPADMVERGPDDTAAGKGKRVSVRERSVGASSSSDGK